MKSRVISQLLILCFAFVTVVAIADTKDKETYKNRIGIQPEKPVTYFTSDMINSSSLTEVYETLPVSAVTEPDSNSNEILQVKNITEVVFDTTNETAESIIEVPVEVVESASESCESLPIPSGDTSFHMFMDFRALTNTASKQWELQQNAWTDSDGFRRIGDDYCVALGTVYGEIGDRFIIITDEENTYTAIMSDVKGTDAVFYDGVHSWYHYAGNGCNVVEFIVQTEYLPSAVTISGSCGAVDYLSGNIVSIERID